MILAPFFIILFGGLIPAFTPPTLGLRQFVKTTTAKLNDHYFISFRLLKYTKDRTSVKFGPETSNMKVGADTSDVKDGPGTSSNMKVGPGASSDVKVGPETSDMKVGADTSAQAPRQSWRSDQRHGQM